MKLTLAVVALVAAMNSCAKQDVADDGLANYDPNLASLQQAACEKRGGAWSQGRGGFYCTEITGDAGKQCDASTDCESACLSRSLTCAPVTPLRGCNDILDSNGVASTVCID
jgi:hypothetical protein